MALATVKESRGEDALMLETSPLYMKSPFNLRIKQILPFNEDIAKYNMKGNLAINISIDNFEKIKVH